MILIALAAGGGCKKPDPEACKEICWKFNKLAFWEQFDKETENLSAVDKEKARKERQKVWDEIKDRTFNPGFSNCVTNCVDEGSKSQVACVRKADTADAARACFDD